MKTDEEKEAYLKWYHNVFYPRIVSQIGQCETELQTYKDFKTTVEGLKANLEECAMLTKNTYGNVKAGVSCADFNEQIEKINIHGTNLEKYVVKIEGIIGLINNKINEINNEISGLRSQLRF